jgi:DNA (cytosine-5)-methyltransferase 1
LHLFAGAGGGILGGHLLGHTTVCAVEIEPYPVKVLLQRQRDGILPKFPIWSDCITKFDGKPWRGKVDVVCGGFPCTGISSARTNNDINGKQNGLDDPASGLWFEMLRVIEEIRPGSVLIENSPNLRGNGLVTILQGLRELGYDARWCVLKSLYFGADHHRARMWILADTNESQRKRGCIPSGIHQKNSYFSGSNRWEGEPRMERVADGMANRLDRLRAIGNGQDPEAAAAAWRILSNQKPKRN